MPEPLPLTGLYGKVPAHGDFVRRGLPTSFVAPWDAWLQAGIARARESLGEHWPAAWDAAPAWRFALPAGACGPDAVAGVMLPSEDQVGRRFPITLAALLPPGEGTPASDWFDAVEAAAWAGRTGSADADALAAALPLPGAPLPRTPWPGAAGLAGPAAGVAARSGDGTRLDSPDGAPPMEGSAAGDDVLALLTGNRGQQPATVGPPSDLLALLGAGAPDGEAAEEPPGDVLGSAGADAPDGAIAEGPPADVQGLLEGGMQDGKAAADPPADVLALLGAAGQGTEAALPAADTDGTLAMLIGAGEAGPGSVAATAPETDPLAMLIGDATGTGAAAPQGGLPPAASCAPAPAAEPAFAPPAEAPPPPEGGGWWTRGGPHVPPMVWPLAALPPAEDFAYLLEAEA